MKVILDITKGTVYEMTLPPEADNVIEGPARKKEELVNLLTDMTWDLWQDFGWDERQIDNRLDWIHAHLWYWRDEGKN